MEEIVFKGWRLVASIADTDVLKLDIEATDGADIIEAGFPGQGPSREGEQYTLRFTTQSIEDARSQTQGSTARAASRDAEMVEDEDETVYLRGWEVTGLVDEDSLLNVIVEKGEATDIFELDPLESGMPLSSHVVVRLASEETDDDEDDEEEDDDDLDEDSDDLDDYDETDEYEDEYDDEYDEEEEYTRYDDLYERDEDLY